ncbi:DinB family protein (plasmid) [Emticicia oligotrophica DSM 17448]|uniref:DinB family protein n=1 Tax=Emticicia oligotrophica (strain DSM 17448 / CIP 109782 / MTCC 6937 / GPTSA100-15) TaxID=929562 RepID=A0ABM5N7T6_EMTOG|nr:DinB family protein [Emticicia oligotrophica]AFK05491.1 DinB family protein [Emticicia oligotrophica DSM 17448]
MNKFIILCILVMGSILSANAQTDTIIKEIAQKWANAKDYTLKTIEAMPEDKFGFRPMNEEMTFSEQITHISGNMLWLSSSHLTKTKPSITKESFTGKSKKEILDLLNQSFDFVQEAFQNLNETDLNTQVELFGKPVSKRQIVWLIHDHLTHHRGQLAVYLRLNNIKPPQYIGW